MSTTQEQIAHAETRPAPKAAPDLHARGRVFDNVAVVLRLAISWIFLWAFLDKLFALGFGTGRNPKTGDVDRFGDAATNPFMDEHPIDALLLVALVLAGAGRTWNRLPVVQQRHRVR